MASEVRPTARGKRGFLSRFRRNQAGNVLVLTAALLIPLLALIGSGIDLGRTYVARQRLSMACDAASLAGRRAVAAGANSTTVQSEAVKFLNYNFPTQAYGTAPFPAGQPTVTTSGTSPTVVTVSVNTTLPMTIMKMFGFATMPIAATCSAQQDYVNTDVMLVLDNTGSMTCTPGADANCSYSYEVSGSKMAGMRSAVMSLYDALSTAQTQLQNAGLRLRYGVVPYSSTVNIGKLIYVNSPGTPGYLGMPSYIQTSSPYHKYTCTSGKNPVCTSSTPPTNHSSFWFNTTWSGCLEERQTDNTITTSTTSIPSTAYDLNLDLVPTTAAATQWPPFDPSAISDSYNTITSSPCPAQALALQAMTRTQMQTYMNGLVAGGGTLSDVGMIWGGRLLSQNGIWSAMNPVTYGNMPVNRYLILMTDGGISAYDNYYTSYGVETYDHRASTAAANPNNNAKIDTNNHRQRFSLMCNAIKNAGVQIWVIGFGASFSNSPTDPDVIALKNCATSPAQASYITDSVTLAQKFAEIGQAIGALRLTQ